MSPLEYIFVCVYLWMSPYIIQIILNICVRVLSEVLVT